MRLIFRIMIWVFFYLLVFSFLLSNSFGYLDPDLGWHLKVGEQIIKERSVPSLDYYTYTLTGKTWVDHEWLMNVIMFWVYGHYGYSVLTILFILPVILLFYILTRFIQKSFLPAEESCFFIMFFGFLGILAMAPHLGVRIQEFALVYVACLLIIIQHYLVKKNFRVLIWLLPLFFIWANTHGSFLIGLVLLAFFVFIASAELITANRFPAIFNRLGLNRRQIYIFAIFSGLSVLATLATPYGLDLYAFLGGYANTYYMSHIAEWLPMYFWPIQYWQIAYGAITLSMVLIYLINSRHKSSDQNFPRINLWYLLLTLVFLFLSFKSKRHFPLFFVVSFPVLVQMAARTFSLPPKFSRWSGHPVAKLYFILAAGLVAVLFLIRTDFTEDPFSSPRFCRFYPCAGIAYLKNENKPGAIFNKYNWGGFMIWTWPEKKLFIDGRLPQYEFAGHTLLEEYFAFSEEEKTADKLEQYDIKTVMISPQKNIKIGWFEKYILGLNEEKFNSQENFLKKYLDSSEEWHLTYQDNIINIYEKK